MASCLKKNESFFDSSREFEHGREQVIPYKAEHQFAKGTIMVMETKDVPARLAVEVPQGAQSFSQAMVDLPRSGSG